MTITTPAFSNRAARAESPAAMPAPAHGPHWMLQVGTPCAMTCDTGHHLFMAYHSCAAFTLKKQPSWSVGTAPAADLKKWKCLEPCCPTCKGHCAKHITAPRQVPISQPAKPRTEVHLQRTMVNMLCLPRERRKLDGCTLLTKASRLT
jgi:hypothetical protein